MSLDIAPILAGFDHRQGEVVARIIVGLDGRDKVQMRTELGLIQMEADGHPDGRRPFGCESLLEYHKRRLQAVRAVAGSDEGFILSPADCAALREEAMTYYLRYVCCLHLRDFSRAIRDTERNLEVMDLCTRYASTALDREALEQYRPYVTIMHARARAGQLLEAGDLSRATEVIANAIIKVREMLLERGQENEAESYEDLASLESLASDLGCDGSEAATRLRLRLQLEDAIRREDYRRAAEIRDTLRRQGDTQA